MRDLYCHDSLVTNFSFILALIIRLLKKMDEKSYCNGRVAAKTPTTAIVIVIQRIIEQYGSSERYSISSYLMEKLLINSRENTQRNDKG